MVTTHQLVKYCDQLLDVDAYNDYCPNGLQVEGRDEIKTIVTGVTASQALIDAAIEKKADALIVHHGYFWKAENPCVTGIKRNRLKDLLSHDINLIAYHLPLDAHKEFGNNVQLAAVLNINVDDCFETDYGPIGFMSNFETPRAAEDFKNHVAEKLDREPLHIAGSDRLINKFAWCTGGAQDVIERAYHNGADAFLTGEVSEQTVHFARETGMHFFAAGHHATERYGAKALGEHLAEKFTLKHHFIDIDNPV